jgi:hypothetical protein
MTSVRSFLYFFLSLPLSYFLSLFLPLIVPFFLFFFSFSPPITRAVSISRNCRVFKCNSQNIFDVTWGMKHAWNLTKVTRMNIQCLLVTLTERNVDRISVEGESQTLKYSVSWLTSLHFHHRSRNCILVASFYCAKGKVARTTRTV